LSGWGVTPTTLTMTMPTGRYPWHACLRRLSSGRIVGLMHCTSNNTSAGSAGFVNVVQSIDGTNFEVSQIRKEANSGNVGGKWYRSGLFMIERHSRVEVYALLSILGDKQFYLQKMEMSADSSKRRESARIGAAMQCAIAGPSAGVIAADDFNRADDATGLGTMLTGQAWTQISGGNPVGISGKRAYNTTTGNCIAVVDAGSTSYSVSAVVAGNGSEGYIHLQRQDSTHFWRIGGNNSNLAIHRWNGAKDIDVFGTVGTKIPLIVAGDILRVDVSAKTLKFYHNGRCVYTADAAGYANANMVGLQMSGGTTSYFRSFVVEPLA